MLCWHSIFDSKGKENPSHGEFTTVLLIHRVQAYSVVYSKLCDPCLHLTTIDILSVELAVVMVSCSQQTHRPTLEYDECKMKLNQRVL